MTAARGPAVLVINEASGSSDKAAAREAIEAVFAAAGRPLVVHVATRGAEIPALAATAVATAVRDGGFVAAAGGDGTLNAVAAAALAADCPFAALPMGTFNYFARANGLPLEPAEAARCWIEGHQRDVQVGLVNGRAFLVNASLGIYPRLLQAREEDNRQYGRHRIVALWAALRTLWRERRTLRLAIAFDGAPPMRVRTPTLFVGNNALQLERLGLDEADAVQNAGQLAAIVLPPVGFAAMLALLLRAATGALGGAEALHSRSFERLVATPRSRRRRERPIDIAYDGELCRLEPPLEFAVSPRPLRLIVPAAAAPGRSEGPLAS